MSFGEGIYRLRNANLVDSVSLNSRVNELGDELPFEVLYERSSRNYGFPTYGQAYLEEEFLRAYGKCLLPCSLEILT